MGWGLLKPASGGSVTKTRPTKEQLTAEVSAATTGEVCVMIRRYRSTPQHQDILLRVLFELPLEVWTEKDLLPDYILEALNWGERHRLKKMYDEDGDHKQNPLIILLLHTHSHS